MVSALAVAAALAGLPGPVTLSGVSSNMTVQPAPLASFTVQVPARAHANVAVAGRTVRLSAGVHRVELARDGERWQLSAAGRRLTGAGAVRVSGPEQVRVTDGLFTGRSLAERLTHRLAALRAAERIPGGSGRNGTVHGGQWWMRGFWPGALWHSHDLAVDPAVTGWARRATGQIAGHERMDSHDVGFVYGRSSAAAFDRLCPAARARLCRGWERSALTAADTLIKLGQGNAAAGTIPMSARRCRHCTAGEADTIIDSIANVPLLTWAARRTGERVYRDAALRHAHALAGLLIAADGRTSQSAHTDRSTGTLRRVHTHQGLGDDSAWARGQAWAIYGYSRLADETQDPALAATADRVIAFWLGHVRGELPRWDLHAAAGPRDVSAAAVAAAGLAWRARARPDLAREARELLGLIDRQAPARPPLGRLSGQVYTYRSGQFDDDGELVLGIDFTLEALSLLR